MTQVDRLGNIERSWSSADVARLREMLASYIESPRDVAALSRWIEEKFDPPQPRGAVEALRKYGRHARTCAERRMYTEAGPCDCGWLTTLAAFGGR